MAKKIILLPLAALICFSLNAWDQSDPPPPYNYDIYNYYIERSWLLSPSEYKYYESARKQVPPLVNNIYNTVNNGPQVYAAPAKPSVVLPLTPRVSDVLSDGIALRYEPGVRGAYHFQDLELSDARLGYQGLAWGTTIAQFQSRFYDAEEIFGESDASPRVRRFTQQYVDDGIQSRQFLFFDDQLYEIYVLYGYVDYEITTGMLGKLAGLYGQPINTIARIDRFGDVRYEISDIYMSYNREMQVILSICDVYDSSNTPQGNVMTCLFSNPLVLTR